MEGCVLIEEQVASARKSATRFDRMNRRTDEERTNPPKTMIVTQAGLSSGDD